MILQIADAQFNNNCITREINETYDYNSWKFGYIEFDISISIRKFTFWLRRNIKLRHQLYMQVSKNGLRSVTLINSLMTDFSLNRSDFS